MTRNDEIGQATEKYSQQMLRDYKEYPLCDEQRRKSLIRVSLYEKEEAFEAGARWADRTMVERAICFIEDAVCDGTIETGNMARLIENFKEAMGYENRD